MRFIINEKVYDTDKMTLIGKVRKWYKFTDWFSVIFFGKNYGKTYDCQLYRSQKGNYLLTHESNVGTICGEAISEDEAKTLLLQSDYAAYSKIFGELEEA